MLGAVALNIRRWHPSGTPVVSGETATLTPLPVQLVKSVETKPVTESVGSSALTMAESEMVCPETDNRGNSELLVFVVAPPIAYLANRELVKGALALHEANVLPAARETFSV